MSLIVKILNWRWPNNVLRVGLSYPAVKIKESWKTWKPLSWLDSCETWKSFYMVCLLPSAWVLQKHPNDDASVYISRPNQAVGLFSNSLLVPGCFCWFIAYSITMHLELRIAFWAHKPCKSWSEFLFSLISLSQLTSHKIHLIFKFQLLIWICFRLVRG